jgi:hypothetical protein
MKDVQNEGTRSRWFGRYLEYRIYGIRLSPGGAEGERSRLVVVVTLEIENSLPSPSKQGKLPSTRRRCETVSAPLLNSAAALTWGKVRNDVRGRVSQVSYIMYVCFFLCDDARLSGVFGARD